MLRGRGRLRAGGGNGIIPAGFGWNPPVTVSRSVGGVYTTDYDSSPILVEGDPGVTTYYVDSATGSEANPGTSALPKQSLRNISASRTTKLLIKARGTFCYLVGGPVFCYHDNLCVQAWGGASCIITMEPDASTPLVWTDATGGVWSAPPPNAGMQGIAAFSGTNVESMVFYPPQASLAACQALPGSSFWSGATIYVHTLTGTSPATGHTIYGENGNSGDFAVGSFAYDQRCQFIGVDFRGGSSAFKVSLDSTFTKRIDFVNCTFKRSRIGLECEGSATVITSGCTAAWTRFDGFSYSASAGSFVNPAIEIGSIGRNCGYISAAEQGSTVHSGGKIMRVNGQYYSNQNDQVADVNAGTRSLNLGCTFGPKGTSTWSGAAIGNGGDPIMWLDGCTFTGLDNSVDITTAGGIVYYRNMTAPTPKAGSLGTVAPY